MIPPIPNDEKAQGKEGSPQIGESAESETGEARHRPAWRRSHGLLPGGAEHLAFGNGHVSPAGRCRTVERKGHIYLREVLIGHALKMTEQPAGAWLLELTDEVPLSEHWVHAPKIARALERIKKKREAAAYEADDWLDEWRRLRLTSSWEKRLHGTMRI